jgi:mannose-1-phosphate guanylyltransferase
MRAMLLAAGLGTRLRPLTDHLPKCLVPIAGRPLLAYWLDLLAGFEQIVINTHYLPDSVRAFVAAWPERERITLTHETALLGTGGSLLANRARFSEAPFLVAHADNLSRFDMAAFLARHHRRPPGVAITMMTFETDNPRSCGIVEETADGIVTAFHEKLDNPPGNHANGAVYIFDPEVLEAIAALGKPVVDLSTEIIPAFLGRIQTFANRDYHRDIGTPDSLRQAERDFAPLMAVQEPQAPGGCGAEPCF